MSKEPEIIQVERRECPDCGSIVVGIHDDGSYYCPSCGWEGEEIEHRTIETQPKGRYHSLAARVREMDPDELDLGA